MYLHLNAIIFIVTADNLSTYRCFSGSDRQSRAGATRLTILQPDDQKWLDATSRPHFELKVKISSKIYYVNGLITELSDIFFSMKK